MTTARRDRWTGYALVGPFLLVYAAILVIPLLMGSVISLGNADLFGRREWIGLANYTEALSDPVLHQAFANTLTLTLTLTVTLLTVPPLTAIALLLALALNRTTRLAAVLRAVFCSSLVLSVTIVTLIWRFILTPDAGLIAEGLQVAGRAPIPFLSDPELVICGHRCGNLVVVAGLPDHAVPCRAAAGAGRHLRGRRARRGEPLDGVPAHGAAGGDALNRRAAPDFRAGQLLTSGGPGGASRTIVLYIFEVSFGRRQLGYATAIAELLFGIILLVTLLQYWLVTRHEGTRA